MFKKRNLEELSVEELGWGVVGKWCVEHFVDVVCEREVWRFVVFWWCRWVGDTGEEWVARLWKIKSHIYSARLGWLTTLTA